MTKLQVKETVDSLEKEDRAFLEAYLKTKNLVDNAEFRDACGNRLEKMKAGEAISSSDLKELNRTLSAKEL